MRRALRTVLGVFLVLLGLVLGPIPGPLGIPLILLGLLVLGVVSEESLRSWRGRMRRWLARRRRERTEGGRRRAVV
jgi:hypothetical protein